MQIRFDVAKESGKRYLWFSSAGYEDGCSARNITSYGAPGLMPAVGSGRLVFVTEGALKAAAANVLDAKHHPIIAIGGVSCYNGRKPADTCKAKTSILSRTRLIPTGKRMPAYKNRSKSYTASRHNTGFGCSAATGERRKKASMISCLVRPSKQTMALSCRRCGIPEISCRRCDTSKRTYRRCSNRRYTNQSIQHKGERQWQMREILSGSSRAQARS